MTGIPAPGRRGGGGLRRPAAAPGIQPGARRAPAMDMTRALGSRLSALGSRLSALGSRLSALGSRLSALGSRLSALGSRLSALGLRLSALGSRLSALGSRLSALGSRLSALGLSALGLCATLSPRLGPGTPGGPGACARNRLRSAVVGAGPAPAANPPVAGSCPRWDPGGACNSSMGGSHFHLPPPIRWTVSRLRSTPAGTGRVEVREASPVPRRRHRRFHTNRLQ